MPGNTEVVFETAQGNVVVELFSDVTATVANFLFYVVNDRYDNNFFHRLVNGFVLQGGGYATSGNSIVAVPTNPPVVNEYTPLHPNALGTISMARTNDLNSATSQFFFNTVDNSATLPNYTVFGQVIQGWNVIQTIAGFRIVNAGSPFNELPVESTFNGQTITFTDLVQYSVSVLGVANHDQAATTEATILTGSVVANDIDLDTPVLSIATVNGQAANVGQVVTLASGALVTVNANGTYTYNPNGRFTGLTSVTGATNSFATDTFSYALVGGGVNSGFATVTIRINGADSAGDIALGSAGVDTMTGQDSNDIISALGGNDTLNGGGGNDVLIGGLGADTIDGGSGVDTVSYEDDLGAVFVNLTLGQGFGNAAAGDTYSGIENARGSVFNDTIIGDGGSNRLEGRGGDDILRGAIGADALIGGEGSDTASYEDNQGSVFVNLLSGVGFNNAAQGDSFDSIENLTGSIFADYFIGTNGANRLDGGDGNDILLGALGADQIVGGNGSDTASFEENQGAVFVNLTLGQGFGNAAEGDTYQSIENLVGTVFYDTFIGDANANRLDGARGQDTLTGAGGADTFVFSTAIDGTINVDTIMDFVSGTDRIELDDAIFGGLALGSLSAAAFTTGTAATTAEQRIIYDSATGNLFYDADGSGAGAAVLFATLQTHPTISAGDFVIA